MYSKGEIPSVISNPTYLTYEDLYTNELDSSDSKKELRVKKKFILNSSYYINDILTSGDVVFGDNIALYLKNIKDKLIKDPELRAKIQIYPLKSTAVNAFATHQGIILITTGLLERLETEAQLAYIISHEISHFIKKHSISSHVETELQLKTNKTFKRKSTLEKYLDVSARSRSQEIEADEYAYIFFNSCDYDKNAPKEVFEILNKSHLPYKQQEIALDYFSFTNLPEKLITPVNFSIEQPDSLENFLQKKLSTHPAIEDRIKIAQNKESNGKLKFIVSEADFVYAKQISKYENLRKYIEDKNYERAIYQSMLIEQEGLSNKYCDKLKLRIFYELSKNDKVTDDFTNQLGINFNILNSDVKKQFVDALSKKLSEKHTNDLYIENVKNDLKNENLSLQNQYDKFQYIFKDEEIKQDKIKKYWKEDNGITDVLVIDPQRIYIDTKIGEHYIKTEKETNDLLLQIKSNSKKAKVNTTLLSLNNLKKDDVEILNDIFLLKNYQNFMIETQGNLVFFDVDKLNMISNKYNTTNVSFIDNYTILYKIDYESVLILSGVALLPGLVYLPLIPFYAPFILSPVLKRDYDSYFVFELYDFSKNEVKFLDFQQYNSKATSTLINYHYYNYFRIIRGK